MPRDRPRRDRHDAHALSWIGRTLPNDQMLRTCVICMITGRSFVYFERVRAFLLACSAAAGATEMPEALRSALRGLSFEVRLAYFRFCEDDRRSGSARSRSACAGRCSPSCAETRGVSPDLPRANGSGGRCGLHSLGRDTVCRASFRASLTPPDGGHPQGAGSFHRTVGFRALQHSRQAASGAPREEY